MVSKDMWIGPRGRERYVKAPGVSTPFTQVGWQSKAQGLNGGVTIISSVASHMEYTLSWNVASRDRLRPIRDMYSGVLGPGPIYFIDPMAAAYNVLPEAWSFPAQATYDARPLAGDIRPTRLLTPVNTLDYPAESARYTVDSSTVSRKLYIPLPPGYAAWVGVHGETSGPCVAVTPIAPGNVPLGTVPIATQTVTDPIRFSASFDSALYQGIELSLLKSDGTVALYPSPNLYPSASLYPSSGFGALIVISGMMVQILPSGVTPQAGSFISGQGNSGCAFEQAPVQNALGSAIAGSEISMSAKLTEIGDSL